MHAVDDVSAVPAPPGVRTFKRRAGRVTTTQAQALADHWAEFGVPVDGNPLDLPTLFGRTAPTVLEIGCGLGEATAALAAAESDRDILAVDVHTPGHGNLLKLLVANGLRNVRVMSGDARIVLADMLGPASLVGVRVFFPDPWPKVRHAKRRLVTPAFLDLVADRLTDGGFVHVATDVPAYAEQAAAALDGHPALVREPQVPWRPETRFEARARRFGHPIQDLVASRRSRGDLSG